MTLDDLKEKFKNELQNNSKKPKSRRYSTELKNAVRASMIANGYSKTKIRNTLGISATALSQWLSNDRTDRDITTSAMQDEFVLAKLISKQNDLLQPKVIGGKR